MGWEEILKGKEELFETFLKLVEGKEAKAEINLDGLSFHVGRSEIKLAGKIEFTFIPVEQIKKK